MTKQIISLWLFIFLCFFTQNLLAQINKGSVEIELASVWQNKNTIQIPNNLNGTRFSAETLAGNGPWASVRFNGTYNFNEKHGLRVVLSPFSYEETGTAETPISFAGQDFLAQQPTSFSYQFNSWRVGYTYHYFTGEKSDVWFGITGKVRDAEIKLSQNNTVAVDDNIGFVPLLYAAGEYRFNEKWSVFADIDGLAGGPGRAFDISMKLNYRPSDSWRLGIGYRMLEGGVDNDKVYNFAWFNSLLLSAAYEF